MSLHQWDVANRGKPAKQHDAQQLQHDPPHRARHILRHQLRHEPNHHHNIRPVQSEQNPPEHLIHLPAQQHQSQMKFLQRRHFFAQLLHDGLIFVPGNHREGL